jgi:hypothetical protein
LSRAQSDGKPRDTFSGRASKDQTMTNLFVPSAGQRIPMPGNVPDWPLEGQPVNLIDLYQQRLVRDGDLVPKPADAEKPAGKGGK